MPRPIRSWPQAATAMPATMAPTERTSGATQPRSNAYFRNKAAAMSSAATPIASRPRCPNHCSRSVFWEGLGSDAVGPVGAGLLRGAGRIAGDSGGHRHDNDEIRDPPELGDGNRHLHEIHHEVEHPD